MLYKAPLNVGKPTPIFDSVHGIGLKMLRFPHLDALYLYPQHGG